MHKLIYKDIRDVQIQKEILQYIYQQAKVQAAHNQIGDLRSDSQPTLKHLL